MNDVIVTHAPRVDHRRDMLASAYAVPDDYRLRFDGGNYSALSAGNHTTFAAIDPADFPATSTSTGDDDDYARWMMAA